MAGFSHEGQVTCSKVPVISIIDDDASVRIATSRLVRSLGYLAHAFASADDFLKSQHVNDTWCVIADVQMPGMTGIELQSLLHAQGRPYRSFLLRPFPTTVSGRARSTPAR